MSDIMSRHYDRHSVRHFVSRLDEYDRDEWWDVCRRVRPDLTREQFDAMWREFQAMKRNHERN